MKTLKAIILGLITVLTFGTANAKPVNTSAELLTAANNVLTTYVNALTLGQNKGLSNVLDADFKFTMLNNANVTSYNKDQTLDFLKTTSAVKQDCKSTVDITDSNADITVAKVTLQYPNFTRTNYVTLTNTPDGWKITTVYSVVKA